MPLAYFYPKPLIPENYRLAEHAPRPSIRYIPGSIEKAWHTFQKKFITEEECYPFLFDAKWPNGFCCPRCAHHEAYTVSSRRLPLYQCRSCWHQTSLTSDTIMEKSRTSLRKWLLAIFLASRTECGTSASQLQRLINVTYKTAWTMLHRIRIAISETDSIKLLSGHIKGALGISSKNAASRSTMTYLPQEKPVVIAASLDQFNNPIHIKMKLVPLKYLNEQNLFQHATRWFKRQFIDDNAENTTFLRDNHFRKIIKTKNLFENVNRWIVYTYRGLRRRHFQTYLDHACYILNMSLNCEPIFENLSHLCMTTRPIKYGSSRQNSVALLNAMNGTHNNNNVYDDRVQRAIKTVTF